MALKRRTDIAIAGFIGASVAWACQNPDAVTPRECGNGVVEPAAGEDCEPVGDPDRCGAVGSGAPACRWTCATETCPDGFRCGDDAICRQACLGYDGEPSCNPFETLSTDVTLDAAAASQTVDIDGDGRPEVVTTIDADDDSTARVQLHRYDGDLFSTGLGHVVGERATVGRLDDDGPWTVLAARSALPPPPATPDPVLTRATVARIDDALGFSPVLTQGPDTVEGGPLALHSYRVPADVPTFGGETILYGVRDEAVWHAGPALVQLSTQGPASDLIGPVAARFISAIHAAATGDLASQYCPTLIYGYRGQSALVASNPCEGVQEAWTTSPLALPVVPDGATLGDGLAVGDLNADGTADVAITTAGGRVHVSYAVGDGSFHSDAATLPAQDGDGQFDQGVGFVDNTPGSLGILAVDDFNGDGRPDFITRTTWIRSCDVRGCGSCDAPDYRCEGGPTPAPVYRANRGSLVDIDGDGRPELAVTTSGEGSSATDAWGTVSPRTSDIVIIDSPGSPDWSARTIPVGQAVEVIAGGDIDGDGLEEIIAVRRDDEVGDTLVVIFAADSGAATIRRANDFGRIVAATVLDGEPTLALVSEDLDGSHRRLTRLTADHQRQLRTPAGLELFVVPRRFVMGHFDRTRPEAWAVAVIGEGDAGVAVELVTRGASSFFDASSRVSATTTLGIEAIHAGRTAALAVDLDGDAIDELVVIAPDFAVRTLTVDAAAPRFSDTPLVQTVDALFAAAAWPGHTDALPLASYPATQDLDGDGDLDLWLLTAEQPRALVTMLNAGDGTLDVAGRTTIAVPQLALSVCEDPDCGVVIGAFAAFSGPTDRTRAVSPNARDVLLASRRALFLWTVDPMDASTAQTREVAELAVVRGGRAPLSPAGGPVLATIDDIDQDGVNDVVAGGRNGIRWLSGLAVNP